MHAAPKLHGPPPIVAVKGQTGYGPPPLAEQMNVAPCWTQLISPSTGLTPTLDFEEQAARQAIESHAYRTSRA